MIFSVFQKKFVFGYSWSTLLWYRCYYPHRSRDALSPVCGIFLLKLILQGVSLNNIGKTRKVVSKLKWWTSQASPTSTHRWQDPKQIASQPHTELNPKAGNTFKKPVSRYCLKASMERGSFKILTTNGARACRPLGLDGKQLCRVRKVRQIVDHGNIREGVSNFGKQEYVKEMSCNAKLQAGKTCTLYLTHRICYAGLLLAPAENCHPRYII